MTANYVTMPALWVWKWNLWQIKLKKYFFGYQIAYYAVTVFGHVKKKQYLTLSKSLKNRVEKNQI